MKLLAFALISALAQTAAAQAPDPKMPTFWEPPAGDVAEMCRGAFDVQRDRRKYAAEAGDAAAVEQANAEMREIFSDCSSRTAELAEFRKLHSHVQRMARKADATAKEVKAAEEAAQAKEAAEAAKAKSEQAEWNRVQAGQAENPTFFLPAVSASICVARAAQQAGKAAIKAEYTSARESGGNIIDKAQIHDLQGYVRTAAEEEVVWKRYLKARKRAPVACSAPLVRQLIPCVRSPWQYDPPFEFARAPGVCDAPKLRPFLELEAYLNSPTEEEEQ